MTNSESAKMANCQHAFDGNVLPGNQASTWLQLANQTDCNIIPPPLPPPNNSISLPISLLFFRRQNSGTVHHSFVCNHFVQTTLT